MTNTSIPAELIVPRYTSREDLANSITHGVGIVLSLVGLGVLVYFAVRYGDFWHILACSVFGITLIFSYTASTLYHSIQGPKAKQIFRMLDHSAIFLLIAGTYTPFTLVSLRGPWGWSLFGVIWGLAVTGILLQMTVVKKMTAVSVSLYVAMGWTIIVAIKPLVSMVDRGGVILLFLGGLSYTAGVVFYIWRKLPYNHAVWHMFVLAGSLFHFFSILFYVIL